MTALTSPPYDVFDISEREEFAREPHNIVHVDYPIEDEGPARYLACSQRLNQWQETGTLVLDDTPTVSIYRMTFDDASGQQRTTVGVIGALEVVDVGAGGVLPHEHTTPKAKTDRLDLTRATQANLSPVWGLSLARGLSALLQKPGTVTGTAIDADGVVHVVERIDDPSRVAAITQHVASSPVLIADGHHRYAVARSYRDECGSGATSRAALTTMALVQELVEEQLAIAAIHRLYDVDAGVLQGLLSPHFEATEAGAVDEKVVGEMNRRGALCLVDSSGQGTWLTPLPQAFKGIRDIDSLRLEQALGSAAPQVRYQHGVKDVLAALARGEAQAGILIRPVPLAEIEATAHTGELMPPKSTFFTPKPRTGFVIRLLNE